MKEKVFSETQVSWALSSKADRKRQRLRKSTKKKHSNPKLSKLADMAKKTARNSHDVI